MKWYWIALIILAAVVVGFVIYKATKKPVNGKSSSQSSSPAVTVSTAQQSANNALAPAVVSTPTAVATA